MKITRRPIDVGLLDSGGSGSDVEIDGGRIEAEAHSFARRPISEAVAAAGERSAYRGPISEALDQARAEAESAALAAKPPDAWLDPANIPTSPAIERYLREERRAAAWRVLKLGLIAGGAGLALFLLVFVMVVAGLMPVEKSSALVFFAGLLLMIGVPCIVSGVIARRRASY